MVQILDKACKTIARQIMAQEKEQLLEFLVPHGEIMPVIKKNVLMENVKTMTDFVEAKPTHYGRYCPFPVEDVLYFGQKDLVFIVNKSPNKKDVVWSIWLAGRSDKATEEEQKGFMDKLPFIDRQDMLMIDALMNIHNLPPETIYHFLTGSEMPELRYSPRQHGKQKVYGPVNLKKIGETMPNKSDYPSMHLDDFLREEPYALILDMASPWAVHPPNLKMIGASIDAKYHYMLRLGFGWGLFKRAGIEGDAGAEAIKILRQNAQAFAEFALFEDAGRIYSFLKNLTDEKLKDYILHDIMREVSADIKALRYEFINNAAYQDICMGNAGSAIKSLSKAVKECPNMYILNNLATAHAMNLELDKAASYFKKAHEAGHPTAGRSFNQVNLLKEKSK